MIVDCAYIPKVRDPQRIEPARDRLDESHSSFPPGFLYGAQAASVRVTPRIAQCEDTFLAGDDRRDHFALRVGICHPLLVNHLTSLRSQVLPYFRKNLLQLQDFVKRDRRARVSFHATSPLAGIKVTKELVAENVEAYDHVLNLYHRPT